MFLIESLISFSEFQLFIVNSYEEVEIENIERVIYCGAVIMKLNLEILKVLFILE